MPPDDQFARWAALFLRSVGEGGSEPALHSSPGPAGGDTSYQGLTQAASDLLRTVDAGGVPAFVTGRLRQIAGENGIDIEASWTPNEIIDAIRMKAVRSAPSMPPDGD